MARPSFHHKQSPQALAKAVRDRDHQILRRTVPNYMMLLASMELLKKGEQLRKDIQENLNKGSYAPLQGLDVLSVSRLAKETDDIAVKILKDVAPDNAHDMMLATCMMVLRLVDEGHIEDVSSVGVLTAATLMEEAKDEPQHWNFNEKKVARLANNMLTRAMIYGLI